MNRGTPMLIDLSSAAKFLADSDNIVIFAHRKPDGDAIGSSFALMLALKKIGKKARVECADPLLHGRYLKIFDAYEPEQFEAGCLVAVDIAGESLLGGAEKPYDRQVDLCIDHHKSNSLFAARTLLDAGAAATAEIIHALLNEMGIEPDKKIADAVFTGVATDTGCFKFANTTARSHNVAAWAIRHGAESAYINKIMFDTKSRGRLEAEKLMLETMGYYFGGRCALIYMPLDISEKCGVTDEELEGMSALPRTVEGVLAGVTIRECAAGSFRISLRTEPPMDASKICLKFGGGGHMNAAGCSLNGTLDEVKEKILAAVEEELNLIY